MGENSPNAVRVRFDPSLTLESRGAKVSSDDALLVYRELDDALGLIGFTGNLLSDLCTGKNTPHSQTAVVQHAMYNRVAGYEDSDDVGEQLGAVEVPPSALRA